MGEERAPMMTLVTDPGIKYRFKAEDLASNGLTIDKVNTILSQLTIKRETTDFLYYTGQNPLVLCPIVDLENGQSFSETLINCLTISKSMVLPVGEINNRYTYRRHVSSMTRPCWCLMMPTAR